MKNVKAQRGFTLIEIAVVLMVAALYFMFSLGAMTGYFSSSKQKDELRYFLDTGFLSMKVRYQEYLRSSGYCYTSNPPDYTYADLQSSYGLMPDVSDVWFDGAGALFRIDPNSVNGVVDRYLIIITLPAGGVDEGGYEVHPYFVGKTTLGGGGVQYRYSTPYELNKGYRTAYSTNSSLCVS